MRIKSDWEKCWEEVGHFADLNRRIAKLPDCVQPVAYRQGLAEGYGHAQIIIERLGNLTLKGKPISKK